MHRPSFSILQRSLGLSAALLNLLGKPQMRTPTGHHSTGHRLAPRTPHRVIPVFSTRTNTTRPITPIWKTGLETISATEMTTSSRQPRWTLNTPNPDRATERRKPPADDRSDENERRPVSPPRTSTRLANLCTHRMPSYLAPLSKDKDKNVRSLFKLSNTTKW